MSIPELKRSTQADNRGAGTHGGYLQAQHVNREFLWDMAPTLVYEGRYSQSQLFHREF